MNSGVWLRPPRPPGRLAVWAGKAVQRIRRNPRRLLCIMLLHHRWRHQYRPSLGPVRWCSRCGKLQEL